MEEKITYRMVGDSHIEITTTTYDPTEIVRVFQYDELLAGKAKLEEKLKHLVALLDVCEQLGLKSVGESSNA